MNDDVTLDEILQARYRALDRVSFIEDVYATLHALPVATAGEYPSWT